MAANLDSPPDQVSTPSFGPARQPEQRIEVAPAPATKAATVQLHGRVVDALTGAGIAGAEVSLFAPRKATLSEIKREWADRLWVDDWGGVEGRPWPQFGRNPEHRKGFVDNQSERVRLDLDLVETYAPPPEGALPIARTVSDAEGRFEIAAPVTLGFVRCEAKGYPVRERALTPSEVNESGANELGITIAMLTARHIHGWIVDKDGKRIERVVRLSMLGQLCLMARPDPKTHVLTPADPELERQRDQVVVETKADGSFEADVAVQTAWWESLEADLAVTLQQVVDGGTGKLIYKLILDATHAADPWVITMIPVSSITVRDRASGAPIENIHLACSRSSDGREFRRGIFFARGGRLRLSAKDVGRERSMHQEDDDVPCLCTVWADGYQPLTQSVPSLTQGYVLEFDLERGPAPGIDGEVRDGARALPGVFVGLFRLNEPATYWRPRALGAVAMTSSDSRGRFRVEAPAGRYKLQVKSGEQEVWQLVELPCASPILVDLAVDTRLMASVRDAAGAPCSEVTVRLRGSDGRALEVKTDDQGCARFSRLSAGSQHLQIAASKIGYPGDGGPERTVDLLAGDDRRIDVTLAVATPRFAHLIVDGNANPVGWKAHSLWGYEPPRFDVEKDGRIPIDMGSTDVIAIESPEHAEWRFVLPTAAPDGFPIRIEVGGPGYEGTLSSLATGKPLANVRVIARPRREADESGICGACITDADGHYRIRGLQKLDYYFAFERLAYPKDDLEEIYALPTARPGEAGAPLAIALPLRKAAKFEGLESITVRGVARRESAPGQQLHGAIASQFDRNGYALRAFVQIVVRPDGQYEAQLPAAPHYVANFWCDYNEHPPDIIWSASGSGDSEVHDFELP